MNGQEPDRDRLRRNVPRDVRLAQILEAAGELFAERGYQHASMSEVARRVGVSKPVIYDLVGSKEELFRLCVEASARELVHVVAESGAEHEDLRDRIRASGVMLFGYLAQHHQIAPVMFRDSYDDAGDPITPFRRTQIELFEVVLRDELQRRGVEADPRKIEAAASAAVGAGEGLVRWWARGGQVDPETFAEWMTTLMLNGLEAFFAD